ncbi:MAG TPA: 50S ribosomal protein L9 [Burkholderiales bacterium]|jgi:large subunit ribosomal protein L9|nr:50S ribosomal protein L9 [Burkholderiales bacterium]
MQVILLEKIANLGQLGEVVKVKDGFARNFLIPHGKAKRATAGNLAEFEKRRADLEKAQAEALAQAQEKAAQLEGMTVQVTQKAGVDGKLFGSVTNIDVADALKGRGVEVPRSMIRMPQGPLKMVGDHPIKVALHADVVVTVTVSVLGEQ